MVNSDPYGDGWLIRLKLDDPGAKEASMLSVSDYERDVASEVD